jgi:hypothetical protein
MARENSRQRIYTECDTAGMLVMQSACLATATALACSASASIGWDHRFIEQHYLRPRSSTILTAMRYDTKVLKGTDAS